MCLWCQIHKWRPHISTLQLHLFQIAILSASWANGKHTSAWQVESNQMCIGKWRVEGEKQKVERDAIIPMVTRNSKVRLDGILVIICWRRQGLGFCVSELHLSSNLCSITSLLLILRQWCVLKLPAGRNPTIYQLLPTSSVAVVFVPPAS